MKYYTCCPDPYPDLTFSLRLQRKTAFYTFILILPCTLLSLLTLVIFWVPPESPAKLQLGEALDWTSADMADIILFWSMEHGDNTFSLTDEDKLLF